MKIKYLIIIGLTVLISCKKSEFLSVKPDNSLVVPENLDELQAILDNRNVMNGTDLLGRIPVLGEIGADDYYINNDYLNSASLVEKNLYIWSDDIYTVQSPLTGWQLAYETVFYANVVLEKLKSFDIKENERQRAAEIEASAKFYRAHMFYQLAQVYAPVWESGKASTEMGIPLRLRADVNEKINRATLKDTYERVINDLEVACKDLPNASDIYTRPTRAAAYGLLARVYLAMRDYNLALQNAEACLQIRSNLIDYNTLNTANFYPFPFEINNTEIIYSANLVNPNTSASDGIIMNLYARVNPNLYNEYQDNDLRKSLFFIESAPYFGDEGFYFRGSYNASDLLFGGIATDEIYLIRAECRARKGENAKALEDLNHLLAKRWKTGTFNPFSVNNVSDVLGLILKERRKELIFRGLRWTDLRRFNLDGTNMPITRSLNGQIYTLSPNSLHYTYLIPADVMGFNPDMVQNAR